MSWRAKQSAVDILVSVPHTPRILNGPHNMQLQSKCIWPYVCKEREREREGRGDDARVYCSCVEVMRTWGKRDSWGVGAMLAVGNVSTDQACSVHFITLFSSRGPGVCRRSFCGQQSAGWLDELYLGKWMLLISTPCYMDHLATWWVLDKTAWWISHRPKLPLLLS